MCWPQKYKKAEASWKLVSKRDFAMQIRETNLRDPSEIPIVHEGEWILTNLELHAALMRTQGRPCQNNFPYCVPWRHTWRTNTIKSLSLGQDATEVKSSYIFKRLPIAMEKIYKIECAFLHKNQVYKKGKLLMTVLWKNIHYIL